MMRHVCIIMAFTFFDCKKCDKNEIDERHLSSTDNTPSTDNTTLDRDTMPMGLEE